ncbi:MAG: hypothetical protein ACRDRE_24160 [Pseudonocardiaceae bacterium]
MTLLPPDALRGMRLGISVSESTDLGRLGLLEEHFRLALGEIARVVLVSGGGLAYGGDLRPGGYTEFLEGELQRYGRRDRPLLVCLAWQEHRKLSLSDLLQRRNLGLLGRVVCLDPEGVEIDPAGGRSEAPVLADDPDVRRRALTAMRRYLGERTDGRVLLGGKRRGFHGEIPGLMEEALLALVAHQPLYLAGGYGGVTLDIARILGIADGSWLPPETGAPPADPRFIDGQARLTALTRAPNWCGMRNGLSDHENRTLATSHRPSDIAALISLGLGRLGLGRQARDRDPDATSRDAGDP